MAKREDFEDEMGSGYYKLGKAVKGIKEGGVGKALTKEIEKLLNEASDLKQKAAATKDEAEREQLEAKADLKIKMAAMQQEEAKKKNK